MSVTSDFVREVLRNSPGDFEPLVKPRGGNDTLVAGFLVNRAVVWSVLAAAEWHPVVIPECGPVEADERLSMLEQLLLHDYQWSGMEPSGTPLPRPKVESVYHVLEGNRERLGAALKCVESAGFSAFFSGRALDYRGYPTHSETGQTAALSLSYFTLLLDEQSATSQLHRELEQLNTFIQQSKVGV